jgi:small G protein signaling modulator 1
MVLVGQDGVQRPAIHFPAGGHLLAFLTCLETALQPHGRLDPPLWSQTGKGKVFPKIKRKGAAANVNKDQENGNGKEEDPGAINETSDDYVFRIMFNNISENPGQFETTIPSIPDLRMNGSNSKDPPKKKLN